MEKKFGSLIIHFPDQLKDKGVNYPIKVVNNGSEETEIKLYLELNNNENIKENWYQIEPEYVKIKGDGNSNDFVLTVNDYPIINKSPNEITEEVTLLMVKNSGQKVSILYSYNLTIPPKINQSISLVDVGDRLSEMNNLVLTIQKTIEQQQRENHSWRAEIDELKQENVFLKQQITALIQKQTSFEQLKLQQDSNLETQIQRFNTLIDNLKDSNGKTLRFACGSTIPGNTQWEKYSDNGIYVDIDTSSAGFTETPYYFTSLGGDSSHWVTTGATSLYPPDNKGFDKGFRVYVRFDGSITPAKANELKWYIQWLGIGV